MASNRKKIDNRIRVLIENGVILRHRSFFVIVGDKGRDQVVILHHILSKAEVKARPNVLWCYKKELGFSSHRKKRMKVLQKKIKSGTLDLKKDDPFELFIAATNIRYCYYADTHKILGNTYGMCVLQDFEALTPNLLARTVETVEGGGVVVLLLRTINSLKKLYTMTMDVHSRYRTEAHQDVVGRFNERFILSLTSCQTCMVIDDQLNILPISSHIKNIKAIPQSSKTELKTPEATELRELKESLSDTPPVGALVKCTKTLDQAKGLLQFIEAISEKTLRSTVAMTAARGRGKSAALGLAIAASVGFGYSNIFVTSPSPENLKTLFEFVFKGFDALEYLEHEDYEIIQSTNPEFNKAIVRVNVYHDHRQTIQYIHPSDSHKLDQAELVVIDEAAAIPLPLVKKLLGHYLVFMASTINGYEGTGRSLSLKLIDELRRKSADVGMNAGSGSTPLASNRILREVTLEEPIRYAFGDEVEKWLHALLCLDAAKVPKVTSGCPLPRDCELYYVNRDTLFCYHKASEDFLHRIMSLYVASHYKNTPNDLQLLSDAPAHHIFVLLPPVTKEQTSLPDVLCVLQVCLEGEISKKSVMNSLSRGKRAFGDLIPWTVSQQFVDPDFASLSGARIVRIATHPDFQRMGYGSRALELVLEYYEGRISDLSESEVEMETVRTVDLSQVEGDLLTESVKPRSKLPPLLNKLSERTAERLDYLGVSFGLTDELFRFWKRSSFVPVYLRQTANDLTGEHSCIMLKTLNTQEATDGKWLAMYNKDFQKRFVSLLSFHFKSFLCSLAMNMVQTGNQLSDQPNFAFEELQRTFSKYDLKRLELYSRQMADHHLITDLLPKLAQMYVLYQMDFKLSAVQSAILLGIGLQRKSVEDLEKEFNLPVSQILGLFNRIIRKFSQRFEAMETKNVESSITAVDIQLKPLEESLSEELKIAADEIKLKQKNEVEALKDMDLSRYAIEGEEEHWQEALSSGKVPNIISVRSGKKRTSSGCDAPVSKTSKEKLKKVTSKIYKKKNADKKKNS